MNDTPHLSPAEHSAIAAISDPAELVSRLAALDPDDAAEVLAMVPEDTLRALKPEPVLLDVVEDLADDDQADVLAELSTDTREYLLESMGAEGASLERLLAYDPESAGGLMTTVVATVHAGVPVGDAIESIRRHSEEGAEIYGVFVVDGSGRLRGTLPLDRLVLMPPSRRVDEVMLQPEATVPPDMDQEQVARTMARFNLTAIAVVDDLGVLLGQVTFDDVIDVVEAEQTEDLLKFGGTSADEELGGSWHEAVRSRLPWLYVNLVTAMLAGGVVFLFQGTISRMVALAVWMPIIAGMGGNAGTQALAVTVRRLALGLLPRHGAARLIGKEFLVGAVNGVSVGTVVAIVASIMHEGPQLGFIVMAAMIGNLAVAGLAGASIPLVLQRLGVDPAIASSVFVTTFTDVCGFTLLLGMASLFLM